MLAVVGSGPSALYTVKYVLRRLPHITVNIFEKLTEPFGLVRFGVAPDHPEVKNVAHEFTDMFTQHPNINVHLNQTITDIQPLLASHKAVLVATGAQGSKNFPVNFRPHQSARDFVLWYNGHPEGVRPEISPEKAGNISVVGMGNVALDVARLLSKNREALEILRAHGLSESAFQWLSARQTQTDKKTVKIIARRGYPEAAFTNKEFRELLHVDGALAVVDPADLRMDLASLAKAVAKDRPKKRGLEILEQMMKNFDNVNSTENIIQLEFNQEQVFQQPCDLLISSVGFQVQPISGLPMDAETGAVAHVKGRVTGHPGVYVVGWAKRGPRGNIASNIPDATETAEAIVNDLAE